MWVVRNSPKCTIEFLKGMHTHALPTMSTKLLSPRLPLGPLCLHHVGSSVYLPYLIGRMAVKIKTWGICPKVGLVNFIIVNTKNMLFVTNQY